MTHVLIAGGGIGGLAAALTLHDRGIESTVIERADQLRALGVGINLLPHAVRELHELGLGDALTQIAVAPAAITYYDTAGELLFCEPRGIDGGYGYPQYSVHRGRLQMLLAAAVRDRLGAGSVRTGTSLLGFAEDRDAVAVQTSAGDLVADVLVGADGIHSLVRTTLHPGPDPLLWSGVRMFRGATPGEPFLDGRTMAIVKGADGVELVVYRIGGGLINWVVLLPESDPGPLPGDARWNQPGDRFEVAHRLRNWRLGWLDAADLVRRTETVLEYPMVDRDPLPWWGRGPVTLLGDAAHPMYPVGANGGSQAVLDARVLAEELAAGRGPAGYEARRIPETTAVVRANREMHAHDAAQPDELARVTTEYRRNTFADRSV
ncbi:FAD-dependent monooxygenase [Mycobacterium sp. 21AC1]|uniref:FAD-dependent monooxygenase n=1 Tax=[Mycobacterium] appelbergii TaxID=2939269 RepID=UPI002938E5AC|nr:FAD-dependent monooxygenase [Mycobacterium sp. 21AC1]MDV3129647.1 FAD-dependent monooxygenase [Mycobacterium sp. 21AC1]